MHFFNSGFFWFVEGMLFVVVILAVRAWVADRGLRTQAWKWLLFLLWIGLAGFTIAFVGTSFGEGEPDAAIRGGLLFGLISIISGVGVWRLFMTGAVSGDEASGS